MAGVDPQQQQRSLEFAHEDSTTDANHDTATILDPATAAMLSLLNERRSGISVMSD